MEGGREGEGVRTREKRDGERNGEKRRMDRER